MPRTTITLLLAGLLCIGAVASAQASPVAGLTFGGRRVNPHGRTVEMTGSSALFTGEFVNYGTFKSTNTLVTFRGAYTEMGSFISDPSSNYFVDLIVGTGGVLTGSTGDLFVVTGNFLNGSLQNTAWNTAYAELEFSSGGTHAMVLAGSDMGASFLGYINNFAWGILRLASGQSLTLSDGNGTAGGAFYTDALILDGGVSQIASITGNGFNIYYNPGNTANAYLGGKTYALAGGGAIIPVRAALKLTIKRLTNGHILLQCLGVPNRSHTIQASPSLTTAFSFLASSTAAADGTFQFEDVNAPGFTRRFYRLTFP